MSGDCFEDEHCLSLDNKIFKSLVNTGRCIEKINHLIDDNIFQNLSKHNPWWDKDEDGDKLHDLRMKLSYIQDELMDISALLQQHE